MATRRELLQAAVLSSEGVRQSTPPVSRTRARDAPQFQYDAQNTGVSEQSLPGDDLVVDWVFETPGAVTTPPALADGTVYVLCTGSRRESLFVDQSNYGSVHAVNAADGRRLWRVEVADDVSTTPAVAGDTVYVVADNGVLSVDTETGAVTSTARTSTFSHPALTDDRVYSAGFRISALDRDGDDGWSLDTDIVSGRGIGAGHGVVCVTGDELAVYDSGAGATNWTWSLEDGTFLSAPVVTEDTVVVTPGDGVVRAFDSTTGDVRWRYSTPGQLQHSPAVTAETVMVPGGNYHLHAVDRETGRRRWRVETEAWYTKPPVVAGDRVYATSGDRLYVIGLHSGVRHAEYRVPGLRSGPVVAGETVYVGTDDGLYALRNRRRGGAPRRLSRPSRLDGETVALLGGAVLGGVGGAVLGWLAADSRGTNTDQSRADAGLERARAAMRDGNYGRAAAVLRRVRERGSTVESEATALLTESLERRAEQDRVERLATSAEAAAHEAVAHHATGEDESAAEAYRQARDDYDELCATVDADSFEELFGTGLTVDCDTTVAQLTVDEISGIGDAERETLTALGVDEVADLRERGQVEVFVSRLDSIGEETVGRLRALTVSRPEGSVELTDLETVERRRDRIASLLERLQ